MYYDRHGAPLTQDQWVQLRGNDESEYWRVARTAIMAPHEPNHTVHVSTVWLGLDHGTGDEPKIFETLVHGPHGGEVVQRFATEDEAAAGHRRRVAAIAADITDATVTDLHKQP